MKIRFLSVLCVGLLGLVGAVGGGLHSFQTTAQTGPNLVPGGVQGFWVPAEEPQADCIGPVERAALERTLAEYERQSGSRWNPHQATPQPYRFLPQAGTLWQDLLVSNFVDLDPGSGIRDWDCTDFTYNGHRGHDISLRSFREQEIGIPVFALLDGKVVDAHDGEFDQNTSFDDNARANYVVLDHGNSQFTWYYHFKKNSVAVKVGDQVKAGTQLGLTGSSGYSTGPHLHLESRFRGTWFEPSVGRCNSGTSTWVSQTPIRRDTFLFDFCFSRQPFGNDGGLPFETVPRLGTLEAGNSPVYFRMQIGNLPANSTFRARFLRPDGSTALDFPGRLDFTNGKAYRQAYAWFFFNFSHTVPGNWKLQFDVNATTVIEAPFTVVASSSQASNRPPNPITVKFDPAEPTPGDVIFCRVQGGPLLRDPDYDVVRYRYQWRRNGTIIREVVSAGLADALPRNEAAATDELTCTVTPLDDTLAGPGATATTTFGSTPPDQEPPQVKVLVPSGGETFKSGSSVTIQWQSTDNLGVVRHDVLLSTDGGGTFPLEITTGLAGNTQQFLWTLSATIAKTSQGKIRVVATDAAGNQGRGESDGAFKIKVRKK
ncbi:MAG: M23 family metallopeptidase [Blastocatellia bacterium]|nr:M23 family metallopeptidase [Blastocatellia bacterium]